jgi:hypothetical protein
MKSIRSSWTLAMVSFLFCGAASRTLHAANLNVTSVSVTTNGCKNFNKDGVLTSQYDCRVLTGAHTYYMTANSTVPMRLADNNTVLNCTDVPHNGTTKFSVCFESSCTTSWLQNNTDKNGILIDSGARPATELSGNTVRNCIVKGFNAGIKSNYTTNMFIYGSQTSLNEDGIDLNNLRNSTVTYNTSSSNAAEGFDFDIIHDSSITFNTSSSNNQIPGGQNSAFSFNNYHSGEINADETDPAKYNSGLMVTDNVATVVAGRAFSISATSYSRFRDNYVTNSTSLGKCKGGSNGDHCGAFFWNNRKSVSGPLLTIEGATNFPSTEILNTPQAISRASSYGTAVNQSTTYPGGEAEHGTEGYTCGHFYSYSTIHTNDFNQPWWYVDLGATNAGGKTSKIKQIELWNRWDNGCGARTKDYLVQTMSDGGDPVNGVWTTVYTPVAGVTAEWPTTITFPAVQTARYVRIKMTGNQSPQGNGCDGTYLNLAEVIVWGWY